jgi:hypothetical protein
MEKPLGRLNAAELWAISSMNTITNTMEDVRKNALWAYSVLEEFDEASKFDNRTRLLSEMPLCWSLTLIPKPYLYSIKVGKVYTESLPEGAPHTFFMSDNGEEIICLTAGQFVEPDSTPLTPGERISQLREKSPDLIFKLNDQIYMLRGNKKGVEKLGLIYRA